MATEDRAGAATGLSRFDAAVRERLRGMGGDELHAIISRAIDGKFRLSVPPRPDDDDLILAALIDEALALRAVAEAARAVEESNGNGDQEWRRFCDALDALDAPTGAGR